MNKLFLKNIIEKPITGEWGTEGDLVNVLRTTNFRNDGTLDFENVVTRDISKSKIEQKALRIGDIIIEKSGGSPNQPVGRVVYFENDGVYLCNNFTSILRPKKNKVVSKYLFYLLFANHKFGITDKYQNKTTGIINLQLPRYIENVGIPLPPLAEQQRIAKILDAADLLRKKTLQIIDSYDELAQSIFLDMFGDPRTNSKKWKIDSAISNSTCIVPGRDKPKSFSGDIPWITTNDLKHLGRTTFSGKNIGLTIDEVNQVNARIIPKESVLLTCVGDLGVVSIANQNMVVNQQLHSFQTKEKINNVFLMYCLSFQTDYMYKMASKTTVPYMNKTICNSIPIIQPNIQLQNQFASKIELIEKQKELAKQSLKESEDLFNSLLQKAFKGELSN